MTTSFDSMGLGIDPGTARDQDWPCLKQFCVFLENRLGRLRDLLRHLERHDLRILALSVVDSVDCAVARIVVSSYDRAKEILNLSGFAFFDSDVIAVQLPEGNQPFVSLCSALLQAEVNIHYTYPLLLRHEGRGVIALAVDDLDMALKVLTETGHRMIHEDDLLNDDWQ